MRGPVRSLGLFVRFVKPELGAIGGYYEHVVGLPRIRSYRHAIDHKKQDKDMFWGGECILFETFFSARGTVTEADGDPARAPLVPVFRTSDLDALLAIWAARGAEIVAVAEVAGGRQGWVRDTAGLLVAVRQAAGDGPQDRIAALRRARGEAFNPGCLPMPDLLQEIGWVQRRVADLAAQAHFYGDTLGLPLIERGAGRIVYDLGDNSLLELLAGGSALVPPPAAQVETTGVMILRVDDAPALRDRARAAAYAVVHELYDPPQCQLTYVADAEGYPVGLFSTRHPSAYLAQRSPAPEDLEAERRWAEACFAASLA